MMHLWKRIGMSGWGENANGRSWLRPPNLRRHNLTLTQQTELLAVMPIMRRLILTVVTFLTLISISAAGAPKTPDEAVAAFIDIWRQSLSKKLETSSHIDQLKHQVFEPGRVEARSVSSEACHKRLTMTLSEGERKSLILVGSLEDLKPDQQVWAISNPGDLGNGFEAYLDQKDGRLLFLWIIPEG